MSAVCGHQRGERQTSLTQHSETVTEIEPPFSTLCPRLCERVSQRQKSRSLANERLNRAPPGLDARKRPALKPEWAWHSLVAMQLCRATGFRSVSGGVLETSPWLMS